MRQIDIRRGHQGGPEENTHEAERFDAAQDAEQHPQERHPRALADDHGPHEMIGNEQHDQPGHGDDDGSHDRALLREQHRHAPERHGRRERNHREHARNRAEENRMRRSRKRVHHGHDGALCYGHEHHAIDGRPYRQPTMRSSSGTTVEAEHAPHRAARR